MDASKKNRKKNVVKLGKTRYDRANGVVVVVVVVVGVAMATTGKGLRSDMTSDQAIFDCCFSINICFFFFFFWSFSFSSCGFSFQPYRLPPSP